jgi:hypothetical protein
MYDNDLERGCLLPVAQSGVTALLVGIFAYGAAHWQGWNDPGLLAIMAGALAGLLVWASSIAAWRRAVYEPEPVYRAPDPGPETVRVELVQPGDNAAVRQIQLADLDATPQQLQRLADGLLSGAPFAEGAWTGAGRPFSRGQFAELRAVFLSRGWVTWRNPDAPAQGVALTPQGKAVIRSFASDTTLLPHCTATRAHDV